MGDRGPVPGDVVVMPWRRRVAHIADPIWQVCRRPIGELEGVVLSSHRRLRPALRAAQEARVQSGQGHVIDLLRWVLGGWQLVESLPSLGRASVADPVEASEFVWGNNAEVIGVVAPVGAGSWTWEARRGERGVPQSGRFRDLADRAEAIRQLRAADQTDKLPPDPEWPRRWARAKRANQAVKRGWIRTTVEPVGVTGLECSYPTCDDEATWRLSLSGEDVAGEPPKMCCQRHMAAMSIPGGPVLDE